MNRRRFCRRVANWTRDVPAVLSRAPDRLRPGAISRRRAVRSTRPRRLPGGVSSAQGTVRSVGSRETSAEVLSRRPRHRSRSRPWAARSDHARPGRLVSRGARRRQETAALRRKVHEALVKVWPRLSGRVVFVASALDDIELLPTDVVVSSHACGALTDRVLERAAEARARVAVLPCCHDLASCDAGELAGLGGFAGGDRYPARRAAPAAGLSHLDTDDPRGDHSAESPPAGRTLRKIVRSSGLQACEFPGVRFQAVLRRRAPRAAGRKLPRRPRAPRGRGSSPSLRGARDRCSHPPGSCARRGPPSSSRAPP